MHTTGTPKLPDILALEEKVWAALVAGDPSADGAMLTEDFLGVYTTGFAGRDDHMGEVTDGPSMADYKLSQARLMHLGPGRVLLAYCADYLRPDASDWERMYISSIWERRDEGWLNVFSQDTPADP